MEAVKIGNQIWQTRNLDVAVFSNGDAIMQACSSEEWDLAREKKIPAWCFYDNDESHGSSYGKLYNWFAVADPRGLAPEGYKIPTVQDWNELIESLGGSIRAGRILKGHDLHWNMNEDDVTGFLALPGGVCNEEGVCDDKGEWGCWWSSSEYDEYEAQAFHLSNQFEEAGIGYDNKNWALSVRCLAI